MTTRLAAVLVALTLTAFPAAAGQWWIPAAAHADGAAGSVWRTDLVLHSFDPSDRTVTVTLLRQGADNSALAERVDLALPAGTTTTVEDVVLTLFGVHGSAGLKVDADTDRLVVTSRTFNRSADGTFGQSIPGVSSTAAVAAGQRARLLGLSGTEGRRTNLGWVSLEGSPTTVTVELRSADGALLGSEQYTEKAYGQTQLNDVFTRLGVPAQAGAVAEVTATGAIQPYASVVAPVSNDPVYVAALTARDLGVELLLPAVVHAPGAAGTSWRTDAWLLNAGSAPATVTLELLLQNQANPTPARRQVTLAPGQQLELPDLVLATFGLESAQGALRLASDQLILATSRTFNTAPTGTFGQFIPARPTSALPAAGETVRLAGASQDGAFRANLGLATSGTSGLLEMTLRGADGVVLATASRELQLDEQSQVNLASPELFGTSGFTGATVEVTLTQASDPSGVFAAYLSVVDNASSDPTYLQAARGLGQDPGLADLEEAVVATTYALAKAVDSSGPQIRGSGATAGAQVQCVTVAYSGDTLLPGQSPEGKCWQAAITFDQCQYTFPVVGWSMSQDGAAAADVCIVDGYPSTLTANLVTALENLSTGDQYRFAVDALGQLTFTFAQGSRPTSALLVGALTLDANGTVVRGWADLRWEAAVVGFELIPVGVLALEFPYPTDVGMTTAVVTVTFDGSEWAHVEVTLGYWHAHFCVNLHTGAVAYC